MENRLTVATFFLTDAHLGAGGFCCVPGSHKSNYSVRNIPEEVHNLSQSAHYVVQPAVSAGDVFIFTEATIHGTIPWAADHERRALLFKYSPGFSSWALDYYKNVQMDDLTDQQQRLLAPASIEKHEPVIQNQ